MKQNIVEKILESHIVEGNWDLGSEIGIKIDQTLMHDNGGTMIFMQFEAMMMRRVKNELSVCYIDHNTVQVGSENADDHKYLQGAAEKAGVIFSRGGNGICHQVHLERFAKPGKTLLGSDSHTCTAGGIGALGIGSGGLDLAVAMSGRPFYFTYPKVIKINLAGELRPWVSAKDVMIKVLEIFTTKGNENTILEYGGPGVAGLTVPERATIANMGAECGVITSVFPSDENTRHFLRAQGREQDWMELVADADAKYDSTVEIDLSKLEPMVALPHSPDNVKRVRDVAGIAVDQVAIGTCTNSSYIDITTVADILKGRTVHPNVSLGIAPGSKQVLMMLAKEGSLYNLLRSGARVMESGCGFCIGNCFSPKNNGISVRTSNRNFPGRSGTKDDQLYLASPQTAAACAITGKITDPRELAMEYPRISMPEKFLIDDSMLLPPAEDPESVEIVRGPNIKKLPINEPLPHNISAEVTIKVGDRITTDHIIPGGAYNKYRSNIPKYSEFVFNIVDTTFYERALSIKGSGKYNVIVGGESYGQGSAREHAALCPMYLGVKAVIAKSFERIHKANLINVGIIPFVFENHTDYDKLERGDRLELSDLRHGVAKDGRLTVTNRSKKTTFAVKAELTNRQKNILLAGGTVNYIQLSEG